MEGTHDISTPSITPVLAGWFSSGMIETREDDIVTLDGTPIDNLQIVGRLVESDVQPTKVFIKIADGTGIADFVVNKRVEEDLPRQLEGINLDKIDGYFRVVFSPQVYKKKITNVANKVEQVTNYNAITFHMLSTVYSVRFRSEGDAVNLRYEQHLKDQGLRQKTSNTNGNTTNDTSRYSNGTNSNMASTNGNMNNEGLKNNVLEALRQLKRINRGSDFTFNQIKNQIGKNIDANKLRRSLDQLQNDGILFEEDGKFDLL